MRMARAGSSDRRGGSLAAASWAAPWSGPSVREIVSVMAWRPAGWWRRSRLAAGLGVGALGLALGGLGHLGDHLGPGADHLDMAFAQHQQTVGDVENAGAVGDDQDRRVARLGGQDARCSGPPRRRRRAPSWARPGSAAAARRTAPAPGPRAGPGRRTARVRPRPAGCHSPWAGAGSAHAPRRLCAAITTSASTIAGSPPAQIAKREMLSLIEPASRPESCGT
jgi:hypothetical protein